MIKKNIYSTLLIIALFVCFSACGSTESPSDSSNGKNPKQETIPPYTDMSEYKGFGGYVVENNVFDYTGVFDTVYDWGDGVKMPFPKPDGVDGYFDFGYSLNMPEGQLKTYGEELKAAGYKTVWTEKENGLETLLVYNDEFQALLFEDPHPAVLSEQSHEVCVSVYTGFVNTPILKNDEVRKLIEDNGLLKGNEIFEQYYILPIENESIRKAGYYECLVFTEKYYFKQDPEDYLFYTPYYLIIKDGEICLFEQAVYSPFIMSSANLFEENGTEKLVLTATYYTYGASGNIERSGIFIYEAENGKFVKKEQYSDRSVESVAKIENGEIHLCFLINNKYRYDDETCTYSHTDYEDGRHVRDGRRYEYKLHSECALKDLELYDIEECFSEGIFSDTH